MIAGSMRCSLVGTVSPDPVAVTLFYGPLAEAMQAGRREPEEVQAALWIATENDVLAFLDLEDG